MRASLLSLVLISSTGCLNPDDILPVHGTLTSEDAVEGQVVRLLRDPVATRGANCAGAQAFKETTADAEGRFSFEVFRAQAMAVSGVGTFCLRVETTFASGTTVSTDIMSLTGLVTLPPFSDWRAQPTRVDGVLRFEPAAPLPMMESIEGGQVVHRAEWRTEDGGLVWAAEDRGLMPDETTERGFVPTRVPVAFDELALEDFSGVVTLHARVRVVAEENGLFGIAAANLELRSGQTLTFTGSRTPLSRGLPCPPLGSPCPLTDGDLTMIDAGTSVSRGTGLGLVLPVPSTVSTLVLRGVSTRAQQLGVQLVDADGGTLPIVQKTIPPSVWSQFVPNFEFRPRPDGGVDFVPLPDPRFFTFTFDAGIQVKEVRVGFAGGVDQLSEVSLFE
jgi:hypothetical protein